MNDIKDVVGGFGVYSKMSCLADFIYSEWFSWKPV